MSKPGHKSKKQKAKRVVKLQTEYPKCMDCGTPFPLLEALGITEVQMLMPMRCWNCQHKYWMVLERRDRIKKLVQDAVAHGDKLRLLTWGKKC